MKVNTADRIFGHLCGMKETIYESYTAGFVAPQSRSMLHLAFSYNMIHIQVFHPPSVFYLSTTFHDIRLGRFFPETPAFDGGAATE